MDDCKLYPYEVLLLRKTNNVQLLGAKRKTLAGFLTATSQLHVRFVEQTEIFQSTPPLRNRACRILKSTLAARVDSIRGDLTGRTGRNLRDENLKKIEKWQEPPPAKMLKPLPVPDSEPKKEKRGSPPQENEGKVCSDRYEEACQQNAVWNTRRELIRDQEEMPLPLIHEDKISAVDTPEEDKLLASYISRYGHWNWRELPKYADGQQLSKATKQNRTSKGKEIEFEPQSSSSEFTSWSSYSEDLDVKDYLGNGSSISPESVFQFDDSSWMETGNTAIGMHLVVRKVPEFAKPRFLAKTRQDGLSDESFGSGRFESTLLIPDQMHGKRSIARLPNFSDPSTVPFKEEKAHLNTRGLTSSKVRCGPGFNLARK